MGIFLKMETFVYKNLVVPLQGKQTFKFVEDYYNKGDKVLDFGCGIGSNSKLFHHGDYIGVEVDESRVLSSRLKYPKSKFEKIPFISTPDDKIPFEDNSFDLVISVTTVHNFDRNQCIKALQEIKRVSKKDAFITVDAYRNDEEKEAMFAWNLTAKTILHVDDWEKLFLEAGYDKDYYWFMP